MKTFLSLALFAASLYADQAPVSPDTHIAPAVEETPMMEAPMESYADCDKCDPYGSFFLGEFKMGNFRFGEKSLRHIYDKGVLDLQLTGSIRAWKPLYVYGAVEYIHANGRLIGSHRKTTIRIVPLSLGMQYIQPITCDLKYYLTIGPRYFFVHQRNHSAGLPSTVSKSGCGGFINTGFLYYLSHHITVDIFGEYSYKRMHFESHRHNVHGHSVQVGGLTLGGGIGALLVISQMT